MIKKKKKKNIRNPFFTASMPFLGHHAELILDIAFCDYDEEEKEEKHTLPVFYRIDALFKASRGKSITLSFCNGSKRGQYHVTQNSGLI